VPRARRETRGELASYVAKVALDGGAQLHC
jgi:hypothetical protein